MNCIDEISFPHVTLEREIKSSERSRVCLVRRRGSGERYIYRSFAGSGEVYRKLLDVECPYLPKIYDVKEENGTVYVLEEYIQGDTLAFLLEGKPLSPAYAKQIVIHVCRGLSVLHGIGAVHRDIKPENIILRGSDAVLIDFDASRLHKAESITDTKIMGTTGYAAPEQYGFSQTDGRTDIYSLGILFNEMLTGQHPSKVLAEGKFRGVIEKCTRINADQRYASVEELITALTTLSGRRKVPVWPVFLLVFLLLAGLLYRSRPREEMQEPVETQAETERPTKPPIIVKTVKPTQPQFETSTQPQGEQVTLEQWAGDAEGYATTFYYDLDGDGNKEKYLFGVDYFASPQYYEVLSDTSGYIPGEFIQRDLFSCVWRVNSDGSKEVEEAFTQLLTDTQANFWRVGDFDSPDPYVTWADYKWGGAVSVVFVPTDEATWLYVVKTYLDGQELTAQAVFRYIPRDSFS